MVRRIIIGLIVFAILVWIWFMVYIFTEREKTPYLFSQILPERVTRIEIGELILEKRDGVWMVGTSAETLKLADREKVKRFLEKVGKMKREAVVSKKRAKHSIFGVDRGTRIKIWQGEEPLVSFILGKRGPDFISSYLRIEGKDDVFLVEEAPYIEKRESRWRAKGTETM
jgi:hypothetical protein